MFEFTDVTASHVLLTLEFSQDFLSFPNCVYIYNNKIYVISDVIIMTYYIKALS